VSQQQRHDRNLQRAAATPRFSTLTICVRGALRGWNDRVVQHMIERNREVEMMRAMIAIELKAASTGAAIVMKHRALGHTRLAAAVGGAATA
jgi:hypothetical protein